MGKNRGEDYIEQESIAYVKRRMRFKYWAFLVALISIFVGGGVYISLRFRGQAMTNIQRIYSCEYEEHVHTEECYGLDENGNSIITCGYADFCIHIHNDDCYNEEGELICELPEIEEHVHTDECYEEIKVLICGLEEGYIDDSTDEEVAFTSYTDIIAPATEYQEKDNSGEEVLNEENTSDEEANSDASNEEDSNEEVSNEENASDEETNNNDLSNEDLNSEEADEKAPEEKTEEAKDVETTEEVTDAPRKGHVHTDECYEIKKLLKCKEPTLHTHDTDCYDENGNLICGRLELICHTHTKDCFEYEDSARTRIVAATYYEETEHCKVTVVVGEEAGIPEAANLKVEEITQETDPAVFEENASKVSDMDLADYDLTYVLNIGFYIDDEEIEPEAEVQVTIEVKKDTDEEEEKQSTSIAVVHFTDDGKTDLMENTETEENKATFQTESFSAYGVLEAKNYGNYSLSFNTEKNGYLKSKYYDANSPLGIAGNFFVVAFDTADIGNLHCYGNILAYKLYAEGNFGSNSEEVSYIQHYLKVSTSAGGSGDLLALGDSAEITVYDNGNHLKINGVNNDNFPNILQDADTTNAPYIDLDEVKSHIYQVQENLASHTANTNIKFADGNEANGNTYITLADSDRVGCYNITALELENFSQNNVFVNGIDLSKNGSVIINIDCSSMAEINLPERLIVEGSDKNLASRVFWNFYNCADNLRLNTKQIDGCIMAPNATINVYGELNGSVIANNVYFHVSENHIKPYSGSITPDSDTDKIHFSIIKKWVDSEGKTQIKDLPESIRVELYYSTVKDDEEQNMIDCEKYAILDASNDWTYTFNNLEKYDSNGKELFYYAKETDIIKNDTNVRGKYLSQVEFDEDGVETITNQLIESDIAATKLIDGNIPSDSESFKFNLYQWKAHGNYSNVYYSWELVDTISNVNENIIFDTSNYNFYINSSYYFLLEEEKTGTNKNYVYDRTKYLFKITFYRDIWTGRVIKEVNRYKLKDDELARDNVIFYGSINGYYLTSTESLKEDEIVFNNKTKTTQISVQKKWKDENGRDKSDNLPDKVIVYLLATTDKTISDETVYIDTKRWVELSNENDWKYTFEDLDYFDKDGNVLYYTVKETAVLQNGDPVMSRYTTTYSNGKQAKSSGAIIITNKLNPVDEVTDITVSKRWYGPDGGRANTVFADYITFNLWQICKATTTTIVGGGSGAGDKNVNIVFCNYMVSEYVRCSAGDTIEFKVSFDLYDWAYAWDPNWESNVRAQLENRAYNYPTTVDIEPYKATVTLTIDIDDSTPSVITCLSGSDYWNYYQGVYNPVASYSFGGHEETVTSTTESLYGTYTISKADSWTKLIKDLPLKVTVDGTTYEYSYCVEEVIPENAGYALVGYGNDMNVTESLSKVSQVAAQVKQEVEQSGGNTDTGNKNRDEFEPYYYNNGSYYGRYLWYGGYGWYGWDPFDPWNPIYWFYPGLGGHLPDDNDNQEAEHSEEAAPYHSEIVTEGEIVINNIITSTGITIYKYWYDANNNRLVDSEATEVNVTIEIYQTSSPKISDTHENDTLIGTYILMANGINKTPESSTTATLARVPYLNYQGNEAWAFSLNNLPVYDAEGNPYYYYAVETRVGEKEAKDSQYKIIYGDINSSTPPQAITDGTIIINNIGTPSYDFLPSTGGRGTLIYRINKFLNKIFKR